MDSCDKMLSEHEKHQIYVMDFVSHRVITLTLFGRPTIQLVCLFDVHLFESFHLMA